MIDNQLVNQWLNLGDQDLGTAKIIFLQLPNYKENHLFSLSAGS